MTAAEHTALRPARLPVPPLSSGPAPLPPADRIVRQVEAIDAWVAAMRDREQALRRSSLSRDERLSATRDVEALRRTHAAIKERCDRGVDAEMEPLRSQGPTAVIAHRNAWFLDRLALLLVGQGVEVLVGTDNGPEALGAIVAEQPDIVLVGDRVSMIRGKALLGEARRCAPSARLAAQATDPQEAGALRAVADTVLLREHAPDVVADALVALHLTPADDIARTGPSRR